MTPGAPRVEVSVVIRAPRQDVFDAWLTRDRMARFLCAGDTRTAAVDVDPREGGSFRIVMARDGREHEHRGRFVEIDRPARLRFTWISEATGGRETDVTVTFDDLPHGTRVTLVHVGLADSHATDRHRAGWQSILDKLAAAVGDSPAPHQRSS
jgi:uncharacterized protein YndB with AHSA1/START domain